MPGAVTLRFRRAASTEATTASPSGACNAHKNPSGWRATTPQGARDAAGKCRKLNVSNTDAPPAIAADGEFRAPISLPVTTHSGPLPARVIYAAAV